MVTALTASAKAKGLFKQAWVTNGAGVIPDQSLSQANKDNKVKIILIIERIIQKIILETCFTTRARLRTFNILTQWTCLNVAPGDLNGNFHFT